MRKKKETDKPKPNAYIKEEFIKCGLPKGSYVPKIITVSEIKEKYGTKYYKQICKVVNDFIMRPNKMPVVNSKFSN